MAMGLPCVTTTMVNNALGATLNKEILVADTLEGLADHVQRLLKDENEYNRIATAARAFVMSNYQWEDQVEKLETFISSKNVYADK